jgi:hypothetical protein
MHKSHAYYFQDKKQAIDLLCLTYSVSTCRITVKVIKAKKKMQAQDSVTMKEATTGQERTYIC